MAPQRQQSKQVRHKKKQVVPKTDIVMERPMKHTAVSRLPSLKLPSKFKNDIYKYASIAKAKIIMRQPTKRAAYIPFPFLKLPSELRNTIYKLTLISSSKLRRIESIKPGRAGRLVATKVPATPNSSQKAVHRNEVRLPSWPATALLFTCRTIYNEGLSILYSCNKLHFPALSKGLMLNKRQQTSFSLLQHVSFDYSHTPTAAWDEYRQNVYWTNEVAHHVDTTICLAVEQVAKGCPVLKTLTLHVLSFPAIVHLISLAAHNKCATAAALSKLSLELLTIVAIKVQNFDALQNVFRPREDDHQTHTHTDPYAMSWSEYALLNSIAPWDRWYTGAFAQIRSMWPGLRVNEQFIDRDTTSSKEESFPLYEYQNYRMRQVMEPRSIRTWHLKPDFKPTALEVRS